MDSATITYVFVVIGVILISMTLHEAMHGYMAYFLGDDTAKLQGRLTLNPLKHIDPFLTLILPILLAVSGLPVFGGAKPVPFNPNRVKYDEWGAALVAIAGPLTNFVLAFLFFTLLVVFHVSQGTFIGLVLQTGVLVNLGFFVFNMIPIPPLDGSRVLYALAPEFVRRGMEWIEQYGILLVFFLILFTGSLIGSYMSSAIYFFVGIFSHIFGIS
ncbi:MAG TPA: site-2 protease family protein [Candidatus Chromulinivoraceae bacterium]|nr:site-2 protease family protein [Candidatus Chromulinivoraceae bacterium]